jgi:quercetin dioxygenase-like cupin family protein
MRRGIPALLWLLRVAAPAQDAPVPVEEEPKHRTVFRNDYVQAFRVSLPPGEATLMHVHARDDAAVRLSEATVASDEPGRPAVALQTAQPGFVSARDIGNAPLTHRVRNVGSTPFEVVDVQVLRRPSGPQAEPIGAPAAENASMRVYRYELAAGASGERHTHRRPYLLVAATDANLRMTSPDGGSLEHPVKAGDLHWVDTEVTHTLTNAGGQRAILVEIELK